MSSANYRKNNTEFASETAENNIGTAPASGGNVTGKIASGLAWKLLELGGTQGIQLLVSIILARILTPDEFGTISLITVFLTIANTFVQSGFATSLVQNKDVDDHDFSSVLWVSLIMAVVMYWALYFSAPAIADFYEMPVLVKLLRLTGIILFPGAVVSIQTAHASRSMQFRKLFISNLIAVIISGVIAIVMAVKGFGVIAMSIQQIAFYFVLMVVMFFTVSWKPAAVLDAGRVKVLIGFGWKILAAGLLDTIWSNVYSLVIGKKYSAAELGGFNKGEQFPKIIATNIGNALQAVMLPAYSRLQDEKDKLKELIKKTVQYSEFFLLPMMAGLIATAEPLVSVVLTDKWLFCVPYLRILSLSYIFWPIHVANLQSINAQGRSDLFLKLEILKKISGIIFLLISLPYGIIFMLLMKTINELVCAFINSFSNKKLLGYGFLNQLQDIQRSVICSVIMGVATYAISFTGLSGVVLLIVQIITGIAVYIITSLLINRKLANELIQTLKAAINR